MKITLYMAISVDGFIARKNGDSDWVSPVDVKNFEQAIEEHGCIIVGRRTFEQYQGDLYPVKGVTNIVVTSDRSIKSSHPDVSFVSEPVENILKFIEKKGHTKALLIGGGTTNASFLTAGVIDEVILSVHPLILGDGIRLFADGEQDVKLSRIFVEQLSEGLIQIRYKVMK